jgi:hypothetical protein
MIQSREQKKLREGNIARSQLFAEMENKAALHLEDDVGEALGIGAELIGSVQAQLDRRIQRA